MSLKNNITLIGRLTADPELKKTQNETSVMNITIAVDRPRDKEKTDFFTIVLWRASAEYIAKYAAKGTQIGVSGILTTRKYVATDGTTRTVYEIQGEDVSILDTAKRQSQQDAEQTPAYTNGNRENNHEDIPEDEADEELPF